MLSRKLINGARFTAATLALEVTAVLACAPAPSLLASITLQLKVRLVADPYVGLELSLLNLTDCSAVW